LHDQPSRQALVLAPHPDDETFGCGGTIRLLSEGGTAVDVAFLTRGELGGNGAAHSTPQARAALAQRRTREAQAACNVLGVRNVFFLDGADSQLREQPQLAGAIVQLLRQNTYQRVFCPGPEDAHEDHRAAFAWLRQAAADGSAAPQFWLYEVWKPLAANTYVPIDGTIEHKLRAIDQYPSQLTQMNYREAFLGLASYRSLFSPPSKYAEAFLVLDRGALLNLGAAT
jgi:LmbE family N-acetylglucosaminyl deacetylase